MVQHPKKSPPPHFAASTLASGIRISPTTKNLSHFFDAAAVAAVPDHPEVLAFGSLLDLAVIGKELVAELQAAIVGLPVTAFRYLIFAGASLATALAVTSVGVIGFIGLVVPHLIRMFAGSDHRIVVPASALAGGALLVVADTLARTLLAPRQLPVGALTAAIGVPLFLVLMSRSRQYR